MNKAKILIIIIIFIIYATIIHNIMLCYHGYEYMENIDNIIIQVPLTIKNKCICIISRKPSKILLDFYNDFKDYDVYVMIDDNKEIYHNYYKKKYNNIHFIQINEDKCIQNGFVNVTHISKKGVPISWDKALFYFSDINKNYDNIWFIEDDVYFYNEDTIINIDNKYPDSDILSSKYDENPTGRKDYWHWYQALDKIKIGPPYYNAMVCAVRMSKKLLSIINNYAKTNKTLFFLEVMYPTFAKQNNLKYDNPEELYTIVYRRNWTKEDINKTNLYHPIKDYDIQYLYRQIPRLST